MKKQKVSVCQKIEKLFEKWERRIERFLEKCKNKLHAWRMRKK